uniref:Uncharacterized protein n=1 Tax=Nymphaea colorata TaxID=210225 RepID=A0A5K1DJU9_9MAGN
MLHSNRIASWFASTTSVISSPVMPGSGEYPASTGPPSTLVATSYRRRAAKPQCLIHFNSPLPRARAARPALAWNWTIMFALSTNFADSYIPMETNPS